MHPNSWRLTVAAEALPRSRTSAIRMDSMSAWNNSSCSYMQHATVRGKKLTHNFTCLLWLHKNPARGLSLGAPDDGGDLRWWKIHPFTCILLHSGLPMSTITLDIRDCSSKFHLTENVNKWREGFGSRFLIVPVTFTYGSKKWWSSIYNLVFCFHSIMMMTLP